jgi:predicted outer membrane repeat protein
MVFSGNAADQYGAAVYNDGSSGGESNPNLNNVTFSGNTAEKYGGGMYNDGSISGDSSPKLTTVTFSDNAAGISGGGMYNDGSAGGDSSPELFDVTFSGNSAINEGGAMYNQGSSNGTSSPTLTHVTFTGNISDYAGGAMYNKGSSNGTSSPSLTNVAFSANFAVEGGGAMFNEGYEGDSSPDLYNVAFSGNSAKSGGAMYNYSYTETASFTYGTTSPRMINVTFSGNSAENEGGALYNYWRTGFGSTGECKPLLINGVIWNNKDSSGIGTKSASSFNSNASISVMNSILQGAGSSSKWTSDPSYENLGSNIDANPMFVMEVDPSTAPTPAGDLRLQTGSPAVDAGDDMFMIINTDLDGNPRFVDGNLDGTATVDMGAYEKQIFNNFLPLVKRPPKK